MKKSPFQTRVSKVSGLSPFKDETDTGEESEQGWLASATEGIRKNLAENLIPYGYLNPLEKLYKAGVKGEKSHARTNMEEYGIEKKVQGLGKYNTNIERIDLLNIVMGQPQEHDSMQESEYKPTESKDPDATYYRSKQTEVEIKDAVRAKGIDKVLTESQEDEYYDYQPGRRGGSVLGTYKIDKGVDEKGHYISYYDIWDLNPIPETGVDTIDVGVGKVASYLTKKAGMKSPEIYGRIYYDPKTGKFIE
jgi:hypothetical protein